MIVSAMPLLFTHRLALIGTVVTLGVIVAISLGPMLLPYHPEEMDFSAILQPPSLLHPCGTDSLGRDVLTRVLHGARLSFLVGASGVLLALVAGTMVGMIAAERGGLVELALMRSMDLLFSFPSFVLALFLIVVLGFGTANLVVAIALVYLPVFARLARNLASTIRGEAWVEAARVIGQPPLHVLTREILPNILAPLLVQATTGLAFAIVIEAGLSFIGMGVQPPAPSLGTIMADGREYFGQAPWVLSLTGVAISIALLGLNLLGDGLRDLSDPKLKERA
jgi:peptide/nickel transport system permease protein